MSKGHKSERDKLGITSDNIRSLHEETECSSIEEYVIEIGENTKEFQAVVEEKMGKSTEIKQFQSLLGELWLECNVLHKTAVFLRQCFADPISRACLTDAKDKNAKFARHLLMIDIIEAQGLKKGTASKVTSIESLVQLFS